MHEGGKDGIAAPHFPRSGLAAIRARGFRRDLQKCRRWQCLQITSTVGIIQAAVVLSWVQRSIRSLRACSICGLIANALTHAELRRLFYVVCQFRRGESQQPKQLQPAS